MTDLPKTAPTLCVDESGVKLSDSDAAYKVRFIDRDDNTVVDLLLTGSDTPQPARLKAGVYQTYVQQIGGTSGPIGPFDVTVGATPCTVPLTDILDAPIIKRFSFDALPVRRSSARKEMSTSLLSDTVRYSDVRAGGRGINAGLATSDQRSGRGFTTKSTRYGVHELQQSADEPASIELEGFDVGIEPDEIEPAQEEQPFKLGASEDDSPDGSGHWSAAGTAGIDVERMADGSLIVQVAPSDLSAFEIEPGPNTSPGAYPIRPLKRLRLTYALASSPPVRIPIPLFRAGVDVEFRPQQTVAGLDVAVHIIPKAPAVAALVEAMEVLTGAEAEKILDWTKSAIQVLSEKYEDPWAAVVAALLLVRTGKVAEVRQWVYNLENVAATTADAAVAAAWAAAGEDKPDEKLEALVLQHLQEAGRRGALTFLVAYSLGNEMLGSLSETAKSEQVRAAAKQEMEKWQARSRNRLLARAFLMWEEPDTEGLSEVLPSGGYRELASGMLCDTGFAIDPLALQTA